MDTLYCDRVVMNVHINLVLHPGDITIADYWGIENAAPGFADNKEVSLVLINNEKGKRAFETVKNQLIFKQRLRIACSLR